MSYSEVQPKFNTLDERSLALFSHSLMCRKHSFNPQGLSKLCTPNCFEVSGQHGRTAWSAEGCGAGNQKQIMD